MVIRKFETIVTFLANSEEQLTTNATCFSENRNIFRSFFIIWLVTTYTYSTRVSGKRKVILIAFQTMKKSI